MVHPEGHVVVLTVVVVVQEFELATWQVIGAQVKNPKNPQDKVHFASHERPLQGA